MTNTLGRGILTMLQLDRRAVASATPAFLSGSLSAEPIRPIAQLGALNVAFAREECDIAAAQRLRFRVFFEEGSATPDSAASSTGRDVDRFDPFCQHLIVTDRYGAVVGTCRLLTSEGAARAGGFYSEGEFDLASLRRQHHSGFVELGRFCVAPEYRDRRTAELLWQGIWAFVCRSGAAAMIGCASLPGTEPALLAPLLHALSSRASSPSEWRVQARPDRAAPIPPPSHPDLDPRATLRALPTLLKGYLRLGATIGEGAAIDRDFGTTDVFVVLPVASIAQRYLGYFGNEGLRLRGC